MKVARVKLIEPLTPMEWVLVEQLAEGQRVPVIAAAFDVSAATLRVHARNAASKIPGTLPVSAKIILWYRGGTIESLHAWSSAHRNRKRPCHCGHCNSAEPPPIRRKPRVPTLDERVTKLEAKVAEILPNLR